MNKSNSSVLRRHNHLPKSNPEHVKGLRADHPAVVDGHTIFPSTVVDAEDAPRLLVSGVNNRKIGGKVMKGEWTGMPIYTLTLEERATCPRTCTTWDTCYGNGMHMARRHRHGHALEERLFSEVGSLAQKHPKGFVARLHVLGDFYSVAYVREWKYLLFKYPQLHIFGYTARDGCEIGAAIQDMNDAYPERCFIRTSTAQPRPGSASVITDAVPRPDAVICPAELSKTACCSTCGLCWSPAARELSILFILHGNPWGKSKRKPNTPLTINQ